MQGDKKYRLSFTFLKIVVDKKVEILKKVPQVTSDRDESITVKLEITTSNFYMRRNSQSSTVIKFMKPRIQRRKKKI